MARKLSAKQLEKATDKRIESLYGQRCGGIVIPIMKIPAIFNDARTAIAENPAIDDSALGDRIAAFVSTIKV